MKRNVTTKILASIAFGLVAYAFLSRGQFMASATVDEGQQIAILEDKAINESSGLVLSQSNPDCFWTHNDSGDQPRLFLIDRQGKTRARVMLTRAKAIDWEDIAIDTSGETARLVVGDIGGNASPRNHITLYILAEPTIDVADNRTGKPQALEVDVETVLEVTFPRGVSNYESIAVDPIDHSILIIEKAPLGGRIFSVPLPEKPETSGKTPIIRMQATQLGAGRILMATACDISADGRSLVIISYNAGSLYRRQRNSAGEFEPWADVLEREPTYTFSLGRLNQTEAVCFSRDGMSIYVTSEKLPTPLVEVPLPTEPQPELP
jgi:hypothetical protein